MTGYHISIGYQSGSSSRHDRDSAWRELLATVAKLREQPQRITQEAKRLDSGLLLPDLLECAETHRAASEGCAVQIVERGDGDEVMLLASGGEPGRACKESVRRAFCRLVIEEMHSKGIEINLTVC